MVDKICGVVLTVVREGDVITIYWLRSLLWLEHQLDSCAIAFGG